VTVAEPAYALRPLDASVRAVRSVAAALVCVLAAALGHHAAGGPLPVGAVVTVFAGAAGVAWLLSARRVAPGQVVGLLLLCQVGVHLAATGEEMTMGAAMIGAHVLATAVSAVVLAHGERLVWQLAERLGLAPVAVRILPVAPARGRTPVEVTDVRSLRDVRLTHSRVLRGPPVRA
jgi:hypothetical protein